MVSLNGIMVARWLSILRANQRGAGCYPRWIDALCQDDDQLHEEQRYHLRSQGQKSVTARVELLEGSDVKQ